MILYLGNRVSRHGNTLSAVEVLGSLLKGKYPVLLVSHYRSRLLRGAHMIWTILRFNRSISVVLIDTYSGLGFYYAVVAAAVCRTLSISYIPILRGGSLKDRLVKSRWLSVYTFSGAHCLVAPSAFMARTFKVTGFGMVPIQLIPNTIEISKYRMKSRAKYRPHLLWVRSFHQVYNPMMAIDVLKELKKSYAEARLCMVGPDKDGSMAQCKAYGMTLGLTDSIYMPGVLSKEQWHILSEDYDIFINTTSTDNTPVSVMEAMALGLPVISTDVGGIPDLITNGVNGLTVPSTDVSAMTSSIIELLTNQQKAVELSLSARKYVESFDWTDVKWQWFDLLDRFEAKNNLR